MAKAAGRREDETSSPQSERRGPESWVLVIVAIAAVAVMGALIAFAH